MLLPFLYVTPLSPVSPDTFPLLLAFVGEQAQWGASVSGPAITLIQLASAAGACFSLLPPQSLPEHGELSQKFFLPYHLPAFLSPFSSPRSVLEAEDPGLSEATSFTQHPRQGQARGQPGTQKAGLGPTL